MIEIKPHKISNSRVTVPGSKSYTHRMLIAASLSDGVSRIKNALVSEDTGFTIQALEHLGIQIVNTDDEILVYGNNGSVAACREPIHLGNSGTSMRLISGVAALGKGTYELTGNARMQMRPIKDLLDAFNHLGIPAWSVNNNGCPPIKIETAALRKNGVTVNGRESSQYLSALLLMAPCTPKGLTIHVSDGLVSKPYVDLTLEVMKRFGLNFERLGYRKFNVPGSQIYHAGVYTVEADCSQAAYFWAAAAISGSTVKVMGVTSGSVQGDVRFVDLLQQMGCRVSKQTDGIAVTGGALRAIEADLADMPDQVPTLAVVAAFAEGTTVIKNVAHLKIKESDRLRATVTELNKMGIRAERSENALVVKGGQPRGAVIDPYNDHRIAMSFAIAGLNVPKQKIQNESCVEKSFPDFWRVFQKL